MKKNILNIFAWVMLQRIYAAQTLAESTIHKTFPKKCRFWYSNWSLSKFKCDYIWHLLIFRQSLALIVLFWISSSKQSLLANLVTYYRWESIDFWGSPRTLLCYFGYPTANSPSFLVSPRAIAASQLIFEAVYGVIVLFRSSLHYC